MLSDLTGPPSSTFLTVPGLCSKRSSPQTGHHPSNSVVRSCSAIDWICTTTRHTLVLYGIDGKMWTARETSSAKLQNSSTKLVRPSVQIVCHLNGDADLSFPAFACKAQIFHIVPLPDIKEHLQAFNDLALQWVPPSTVADKPESFWTVSPKPLESRVPPEVDHTKGPHVEAAKAADEAAHALDKLSLSI